MFKFRVDDSDSKKPYVIYNGETGEVMERCSDPEIAGAALTRLLRDAGISTHTLFRDGTLESCYLPPQPTGGTCANSAEECDVYLCNRF